MCRSYVNGGGILYAQKQRLSNKFWAVSFYSFNRLKNKLKNKAFMLKFSVKAFVMS